MPEKINFGKNWKPHAIGIKILIKNLKNSQNLQKTLKTEINFCCTINNFFCGKK